MEKLDIWNMLLKKFPEKEYVLMEEVRDAAGFSARRSADYVAMNLWPSRGLSLIGIELKSFRSDWLNELKKPEKAENIFKYCDFFYLLTTNDTIAKIDEIPVNWGWMSIKGSLIKIMKTAPKLSPQPITRDLVATMLKRASDKTNWVRKDDIQDHVDAAKQHMEQRLKGEHRSTFDENNRLKNTIAEFESAAGVRFGSWGPYDPKTIGAAVKLLNTQGTDSIKSELLALQSQAQRILDNITATLNIAKSTTVK